MPAVVLPSKTLAYPPKPCPASLATGYVVAITIAFPIESIFAVAYATIVRLVFQTAIYSSVSAVSILIASTARIQGNLLFAFSNPDPEVITLPFPRNLSR